MTNVFKKYLSYKGGMGKFPINKGGLLRGYSPYQYLTICIFYKSRVYFMRGLPSQRAGKHQNNLITGTEKVWKKD